MGKIRFAQVPERFDYEFRRFDYRKLDVESLGAQGTCKKNVFFYDASS